MPIEFWQTNNGGWFWTTRSSNGEIIAYSAEVYSSRAKAVNGAKATAQEFRQWQIESARKRLKSQISGRSKLVAKRSTSSSNPTRKTGKREG